MRILLFCCLALLALSGCESDEMEYPRLYTYSHLNTEEAGIYLYHSPGTSTELPLSTGSFGSFYDTLDHFYEGEIAEILFFEKIELLSEDQVRILLKSNGELYDTVFSYTLSGQQIIIEELFDILTYDPDDDIFEFCTSLVGVINGPNTPTTGHAYGIDISECYLTMEQHLDYLVTSDNYVDLDTFAVFKPKLVYKRQ